MLTAVRAEFQSSKPKNANTIMKYTVKQIVSLVALTLVSIVCNAQVSRPTYYPPVGGSGSGNGTAAFTNLTSAGGGQSLIKSNNGTNVVLYSLTNGTSNVSITTNGNSVIISVATITNDISEFTNSFVINTVQTNTTTNILFSVNTLLIAPTVTEGAKASLIVETASASGVFQQIAEVGEPGVAGVFNSTNDLVGFISPGSRFYVTNQSIGGASASIVSGYRQYLIGGLASGGGIGSGTVTSVAVTSSDITVGGSPITTSGTITLALPWSTNLFTDTNMFRLATNGMIGAFTGFTNNAISTNQFFPATNGIIGMFVTYTNNATDTNIFRQATNGIITAFTTFTNTAVNTNMTYTMYDPVTILTYDGVETTVMLVNGNSGRTFAANITKNTTLRFTNFWNGALTNASRPCDVAIRQDSTGAWTVGTQLTNCLVAFGVGGTNLGVRSNANTISWLSARSMPFTNSMMQGSCVTNSIP